MIDWATHFGTLLDAVQAVAVTFAAIAAYKGLSTWRQQLIGQRRIELAEATLVAFYEAEDAIRGARFPMAYSTEGQSRPDRERESDDDRRIRDVYYVPIERLRESALAFARLQAHRLRFRAVFGDQHMAPFNTIEATRMRIVAAARLLVRIHGQHARTEEAAEQHAARIEAREAIIWDQSSESTPDEITQRLNEAVRQMEATCRPILRAEGASS